MRAYLSGLPQPMTPDRSALYARVLGETSSWPEVAVIEAQEIISQSPESLVFGARVEGEYWPLRAVPFSGSDALQARRALASSLARFLTLDLQ